MDGIGGAGSGPSEGSEAEAAGAAIVDRIRAMRSEYVDFLTSLCAVESPTDRPESQKGVHAILAPALEDLGYEVTYLEGRTTGDHLLAVPKHVSFPQGPPAQLLIGHSDTVWPMGTLERMPVRVENGRLHGPGSLDMKGGLTMIVFALRALRDLGLEPEVAPVVFVNADEEIGSPDSRPHVRRLAEAVERTFVVEPALGAQGLIKTARKGVGRFDVTVTGRASHAGLDPEAGRSAILELSYVVRRLADLNDPDRGTTVNVGRIEGGTRANVVAAHASAAVDVRVTSSEAGREIEEKIRAIGSETDGVTVAIEGGIELPPLERTPRNRRLWQRAREAAGDVGLTLDEALAGGGSDGNTTSLYTATLDGLGCVGDGAHADHEHIEIDATMHRCALLARLLLLPSD